MKNKIYYVLLFTLLSFNIYAQDTSDEVVKTEDKRYIAQIIFFDTQMKLKDDSRLVGGMSLGIELWTLLGEPVENYTFKWVNSGQLYSRKHNYTLQEKWLDKYPDLLKRYNQLEPTSIKLRYTVDFDFSGNESDLSNIPYEMKLPTKKWVVQGKRDINSIADFYITKAGKVGKELSPGSPKNWKEFIQYHYLAKYSNEQAKHVFVKSKKATFWGLELVELNVPTYQIDALIGEYLKRENGDEGLVSKEPELTNDWGEFPENKEDKHFIGEKFGGGIVFYVDETSEHGLIISVDDFGIMDWGIAKQTCEYYFKNGYNDWYLPSKDELGKFCPNRNILREKAKEFVETSYNSFWTSTEGKYDTTAWIYHNLESVCKEGYVLQKDRRYALYTRKLLI